MTTCTGSEAFASNCTSIAQAVRAARDARSFEHTALRAAVVRYAEEARRTGCPPERFLVALKECLPDEAPTALSRWTRDILKDRIVSWAIAGYYALLALLMNVARTPLPAGKQALAPYPN